MSERYFKNAIQPDKIRVRKSATQTELRYVPSHAVSFMCDYKPERKYMHSSVCVC